jgi:tetratricopeptide (TPR) repeat protein
VLPSATSSPGAQALDDLEASSQEALSLYQQAPQSVELAGVAIALSVSCSTRGDHRAARELLVTVRNDLRAMPTTPVVSAMDAYLTARSAYIDNRFSAAERDFQTSIELFGSCGADVYRAFGLRYVGRLKLLRGDATGSIDALERALELARNLRLSGFADALVGDLGEAVTTRGDFQNARTLLQHRLDTARAVGFHPGVTESLTALALTEWRADDFELAASLAEAALEVALTIDDHISAAACLAVLGFVAASRGDLQDARRRHTDGLRRAHPFAQSRSAAVALEGLAQVVMAEHDGRAAAQLLGAATALRQLPGQAVGPAFAMGLRPGIAGMLESASRAAGERDAERSFFDGAADPGRVVASALAESPA